MTEQLTYDKALKLLNEAVALKGEDYVDHRVAEGRYPVYGQHGEASCLVGHVVLAWDKTVFDNLVEHYNNEAFSDIPEQDLPDVTVEAANLLIQVQLDQDSGEYWGTAVSGAIQRTEKND